MPNAYAKVNFSLGIRGNKIGPHSVSAWQSCWRRWSEVGRHGCTRKLPMAGPVQRVPLSGRTEACLPVSLAPFAQISFLIGL